MTTNTQLLYYFADFLMYTLPSPRYKYYESSNFEEIQNAVTAQTNLATEALGYYQPRADMYLL